MLPSADQPPLPQFIQLPRTSSRNQRQYAHLKLLSHVSGTNYNAGFEGKIYPPGTLIDRDTLPENPVLLECAGPQGQANRGVRRPFLWILWRYDWSHAEWVEIARAASINWEWAIVLREPAIRALHPRPELVDILQRGRDVASEIMGDIERRLQGEAGPVRCNVLASIYDQVAGRIAESAA